MGVLRTRSKQKRIHAFICLCIVSIIFYKYLGFFQSSARMGLKKTRKMGLNTNSSQFTLEGKPFCILGGSIHYFRVPMPYWRDRLTKMMACGINTLTIYVPWSLHQPQKDVFNFHTQLDLEAYISLAAELGLWVILCPGPYISADMDLGGLPSWLLRDDSMRLRTTHPGFIQAVNTYFDKLIPKVFPFQFSKGGPIIAVQIENEYGSFAKDKKYMSVIKEALQSRGISEILLTSDNSNSFKSGGVDGALRAVKLRKLNQKIIQELNSVKPNKPSLVMEYWTGWYDTWGDLHHVLPPEDMVSTVRNILRRGMSVNLYMFHGGSSFGFMSGAVSDPSYKALVSSYDYDAPLSEAGRYTPKYYLLRDLFSQFNPKGRSLPDIPSFRNSDSYETAFMYYYLSLWDALSFAEGPFMSAEPVNMENLPANNGNGQSYGYTLYETIITSGGMLQSGDNVRDRALVFVDRKYIGLLKRQILELAVPDGKDKRTLSFLVENCGRVHQGKDLDKQRKGLVGDILLNNIPLRGFTTYSLEMKLDFIESLNQAPWINLPEHPSFPGFFMGRVFVYSYPTDTFVKMLGWGKGVVFVNSLNLGRYWSLGPQQSLYLPGPFLHSGVNQVIVFEEKEGDYNVQFEDSPDLGMEADIN
ncbi:beta-galactosidase-1-like protein 2 [Poeciliopsis prolifica]|uniref:beta-galactosidase-1-like protein 2 n=1 Tax=Poeciliopsis prolifica TaxID=188132 RepID=UPI002412E96A|nr:beta-galactosidase-1-like protein 2 [Poeciliopsis prolifica]XP_054899275.1 beta-galactosidase-1-like protein 2 [Poeciliopsis prolifica]